MTRAPPVTATPIKDRGPVSQGRSLAFNGFFMFAILTLHGFQLLVSPLWLAPQTRDIFWAVQVHVQRQFAVLLSFISRYFGPTRLRITSEGDLDLDTIVSRDSNGDVLSLNLPKRSVLIANHQVYCDWLYAWILLYAANLHSALIIILKASLKWVPVVGPAMQLFDFIFLARKWDEDRMTLSAKLLRLAQQSRLKDHPLVLLIFPEGTLVSPNTRPLSKKFAEKTGVDDMRYQLLPRSTGTLFCLRSLAKGIPDLKLIDATIAYPGIPADGYGQDYYTLQSIFGAGQSPPLVHIHLRQFHVNGGVPIGDPDHDKGAVGAAVTTPEEREAFDTWLRQRWIEKDQMLHRFYTTGTLASPTTPSIDLDAAPRRDWDVLVLFGTMLGGFVGWRYVVIFIWRLLF